MRSVIAKFLEMATVSAKTPSGGKVATALAVFDDAELYLDNLPAGFLISK